MDHASMREDERSADLMYGVRKLVEEYGFEVTFRKNGIMLVVTATGTARCYDATPKGVKMALDQYERQLR